MKIEDFQKAQKISNKIHFIDKFLENKDNRMELRYFHTICTPCGGFGIL